MLRSVPCSALVKDGSLLSSLLRQFLVGLVKPRPAVLNEPALTRDFLVKPLLTNFLVKLPKQTERLNKEIPC